MNQTENKPDDVRVVLSSEAGEQWRGLLTEWLCDNCDAFTLSEMVNIGLTVRDCGACKLDMGAGGIFTLTLEAINNTLENP